MDNETQSAADVVARIRAERTERERLAEPIRLAIIGRLIDRHGLSSAQAATAVDQTTQGIQGEHTALVSGAVIGMASEQWTQIMAAIQPVLQAFAQVAATALKEAAALAKYLEPPAPSGRVGDRPAWQSPYGPQEKGHRHG